MAKRKLKELIFEYDNIVNIDDMRLANHAKHTGNPVALGEFYNDQKVYHEIVREAKKQGLWDQKNIAYSVGFKQGFGARRQVATQFYQI